MNEEITLGRRPKGSDKTPLTKISFRVDDETLAALRRLELRTGNTREGRQRSELLRKLILEADSKSSD